MEVKTLKCDGDGCGKLRVNDSNHWLYGIATREAITLATSPDKLHDLGLHHFCGQACAQKWMMTELQKIQLGGRDETRART